MKTIELSDKTYEEVLRLKNLISMDSGHITNPEVQKRLHLDSQGHGLIQTKYFGRIMWEKDFEPEYTFEQYLKNVMDNVWKEQETQVVTSIEKWR
jgi:hypothetical protein